MVGTDTPPPYVSITWRADTLGRRRDLVYKQVPLDMVNGSMKRVDGTVIAPQQNLTAVTDDLDAMRALTGLPDEYVCVGNTNVHLRTAQNKGCRVLVPHPPEFRWMYAGDASPWFPEAYLYRQRRNGDGRSAVERLAADIKDI